MTALIFECGVEVAYGGLERASCFVGWVSLGMAVVDMAAGELTCP